MESPIQEQPSALEPLWRASRYLFSQSRPQFHTALYVLLYATFYIALIQATLFVMSFVFGFSMVINYELLGIFVGCLSLAELVRGHARYWLGYAPEQWCYPAMALAGATLATTFWGFLYLKWGDSTWYEPPLYALTGAGFYTLVGWLMQLDEKRQSSKEKAG